MQCPRDLEVYDLSPGDILASKIHCIFYLIVSVIDVSDDLIYEWEVTILYSGDGQKYIRHICALEKQLDISDFDIYLAHDVRHS